MSTAQKYRTMRWILVRLRRIAARHGINFDNVSESSRKDVPSYGPEGSA